jgi:hypothetical protein
MAAASLVSIMLASVSAGAATARGRTVTDMPDDISGPQVHFLYVVPSDGGDGQLDSNGGMEQSIARIQQWLVTQTGSQGLRVDTYHGVPDITFVRLPHTDAQATSKNPFPIWVIGEDLVAAGFNDPAKIYAAFYDGHSTFACGGATSPALHKLGAMYLQAWPTNDPRPCSDAPGFGTGTARPGYFEIGLLHEAMHTIGFAPSCAPHVTEVDHVDDSPTDLMYHPDAKSPAGWDWSHAVLDFNHDDYYRAHIQGCPDLSDSPYLMPMHSVSVTVTGPGTVTSNPAGILCPDTCGGTFQDSVTLTATPSTGALFAGWAGVCTGTATCVVTDNGTATASFITLPDAPTLYSATPGNARVSLAWSEPGSNGDSTITGYTASARPGGATCTTTGALTCRLGGLRNGTSYSFTVTASNAVGTGPASNALSAIPAILRHRRILTFGLHAHRGTGTLRVVDGYKPCRTRVTAIVERRRKHGWSIIRRVRTSRAGVFAVSLPRGRATYRVRAPKTTAAGQECLKAVSRTVATSV